MVFTVLNAHYGLSYTSGDGLALLLLRKTAEPPFCFLFSRYKKHRHPTEKLYKSTPCSGLCGFSFQYLCRMNISENIHSLLREIPRDVQLVAVSKTKSNAEIMAAYRAGQRIFGENKIQEMTAKHQALPQDIRWHMIGHVQTNKVKYMAPFVDLIHGVDRLKLLREIDKQAQKNKRKIDCLLQVHIARESSKFGFSQDECVQALEVATSMEHVNIRGLMGMATFTDDQDQIAQEFKGLKSFYDELRRNHPGLSLLSMGMSGDYPLAIAQGSNMIRVGSKIFGSRTL